MESLRSGVKGFPRLVLDLDKQIKMEGDPDRDRAPLTAGETTPAQ